MAVGSGKRGAWTLYACTALDAEGQPISEQLKTFESLPLNELTEVTVEPQQHERYGPSYLLKRPSLGNGALRERVEVLERKVAALERERQGAMP
ncbi:MAG TPA: hypothetical protein VEJ23_07175 [Solirubrobacteraceae bacterium]|nr:hypothetical protein [Solirubrobacteraceae bacterium]